jgi:hypothetical protein
MKAISQPSVAGNQTAISKMVFDQFLTQFNLLTEAHPGAVVGPAAKQ